MASIMMIIYSLSFRLKLNVAFFHSFMNPLKQVLLGYKTSKQEYNICYEIGIDETFILFE